MSFYVKLQGKEVLEKSSIFPQKNSVLTMEVASLDTLLGILRPNRPF